MMLLLFFIALGGGGAALSLGLFPAAVVLMQGTSLGWIGPAALLVGWLSVPAAGVIAGHTLEKTIPAPVPRLFSLLGFVACTTYLLSSHLPFDMVQLLRGVTAASAVPAIVAIAGRALWCGTVCAAIFGGTIILLESVSGWVVRASRSTIHLDLALLRPFLYVSLLAMGASQIGGLLAHEFGLRGSLGGLVGGN